MVINIKVNFKMVFVMVMEPWPKMVTVIKVLFA
jgi:hypothetical protein